MWSSQILRKWLSKFLTSTELDATDEDVTWTGHKNTDRGVTVTDWKAEPQVCTYNACFFPQKKFSNIDIFQNHRILNKNMRIQLVGDKQINILIGSW